jgi:hypothetical protein
MAVTQLNPTSSTPTPPGAGTLVAQGLANTGAYIANLSAGSYVIDCKGYGTGNYANGFSIANSFAYTGKKVNSGVHDFSDPVYVKLDNADSAFGILGMPVTTPIRDITYASAVKIATNGSGTWMMVTVNDGTNWTYSLSTDYGVSWSTPVSTGGTPSTQGTVGILKYVNGIWFIGTTTGWLWRSSNNGTTWSSPAQVGTSSITGITFGASLYVLVTNNNSATTNIYTSSDGATWTSRTGQNAVVQSGIHFANNLFVAVGASGSIQTSTNGTTWTSRTSTASNVLVNVTYGNSVWVATGLRIIVTSTDGTTWTERAATTDTSGSNFYNSVFGALHYGGGYFWMQDLYNSNDNFGSIWISSDAINWSKCMVMQGDTKNTTGLSASFGGSTYKPMSAAYGSIYDNGLYTVNNSSSAGNVVISNRFTPMYVSIYSVSGTALN